MLLGSGGGDDDGDDAQMYLWKYAGYNIPKKVVDRQLR